jgi:CTD nuclear envelope phosphatase 1
VVFCLSKEVFQPQHKSPQLVLDGFYRTMNSLNIISARVSPPQTAVPSRSNSYGNILSSTTVTESRRGSRESINEKTETATDAPEARNEEGDASHEETPLLDKESSIIFGPNSRDLQGITRTISISFLDSIRWVLSTLAAPGTYLIACLYDEQGIFAPFAQVRKHGTFFSGGARRGSVAQALAMSSADEEDDFAGRRNGRSALARRMSSKTQGKNPSSSSSSGLSSESESERERTTNDRPASSPSRHLRSKFLQREDEIAPARRSIRIKLHNEDSLRQRKHRKTQSTSSQSNGSGAISAGEISPATLKSPTSPAASLLLTKYPRAPAPPRPLIPPRQPSFTLSDTPDGKLGQKTLILDLDETLIHSLAKGGRMGTGHMIEVRLNIAGAGGSGPPGQHPILYYVHKRPHCDDFLRRVSRPPDRIFSHD